MVRLYDIFLKFDDGVRVGTIEAICKSQAAFLAKKLTGQPVTVLPHCPTSFPRNPTPATPEFPPKLVDVPESLRRRIVVMLLQTWYEIAADYLAVAIPPENFAKRRRTQTHSRGAIHSPPVKPYRSIPGSKVQEAVADAGHYLSYGNDAEAAAVFRDLDRETQDVLLEQAFPKRKRYGY